MILFNNSGIKLVKRCLHYSASRTYPVSRIYATNEFLLLLPLRIARSMYVGVILKFIKFVAAFFFLFSYCI